MKSQHLPRQPRSSQRGVFGILYAIILPVMLGMIGLVIDLSIMYARGHELQAVADGAAMAAARALDGTPEGLSAAMVNASKTAELAQYRFLRAETIKWSPEALSFGATPDGPWIAAEAVTAAQLPNLLFAQVDTIGLDPAHGRVAIAFLRVIGVEGEQNLSRRAVAGRRDSKLGPLAICALNKTKITARPNGTIGDEALEYGFRRGVTYNLLNLNPNGTSAVNYLINPLDFPPAPAVAAHHTDDDVRPFVCSGQIPAPPIGNGSMLYVRSQFPLSMVPELNSRFGEYGGSVCTKFGSPPDSNVLDYRGGYPAFWMTGTPNPVRASAAALVTNGKLVTVADASGAAPGATAASYGTLWSFSKPHHYDSANGGSLGDTFNRSEWSSLYPVSSGSPLSSTYNFPVPAYPRNLSPHKLSPPALSGVTTRRILNVPLLDCPVSGASGRVLGIGRFLMTTPATQAPAGIHAEFGGLIDYGMLAASAVLFQ